MNGLLPAIIQNFATKTVLMLGFMNAESFEKTQKTGFVHFFSRTKNRIWKKGETSGNVLKVRKIFPDCDRDTLLILAEPTGNVCHTGAENCFDFSPKTHFDFLEKLEKTIFSRQKNAPKNSYVAKLFTDGLDRIAQKVGEEAVETIIAAKNKNTPEFENEAADLFFHFLILLAEKEKSFFDILNILQNRAK